MVELDEERKATMVSDLLVVLCSEQATQLVVTLARSTSDRGHNAALVTGGVGAVARVSGGGRR